MFAKESIITTVARVMHREPDLQSVAGDAVSLLLDHPEICGPDPATRGRALDKIARFAILFVAKRAGMHVTTAKLGLRPAEYLAVIERFHLEDTPLPSARRPNPGAPDALTIITDLQPDTRHPIPPPMVAAVRREIARHSPSLNRDNLEGVIAYVSLTIAGYENAMGAVARYLLRPLRDVHLWAISVLRSRRVGQDPDRTVDAQIRAEFGWIAWNHGRTGSKKRGVLAIAYRRFDASGDLLVPPAPGAPVSYRAGISSFQRRQHVTIPRDLILARVIEMGTEHDAWIDGEYAFTAAPAMISSKIAFTIPATWVHAHGGDLGGTHVFTIQKATVSCEARRTIARSLGRGAALIVRADEHLSVDEGATIVRRAESQLAPVLARVPEKYLPEALAYMALVLHGRSRALRKVSEASPRVPETTLRTHVRRALVAVDPGLAPAVQLSSMIRVHVGMPPMEKKGGK